MENVSGDVHMTEEQKMNYEFTLYKGDNITFQGVTIYQYKMYEIEQMGLSNFLNDISFVSLTPRDMSRLVTDIRLARSSVFDICMTVPTFTMLLENFISKFTISDKVIINTKKKRILVKNEMEIAEINENNFNEFVEVFKLAYKIEDVKKLSDRDDISDYKRQLLAEFEEVTAEINKKKKTRITMLSMIQTLCTKHPHYNCDNIWNRTLYQIKTDYERLLHIDTCDEISRMRTTGMFDMKRVDMEQYNHYKEL